VRFFSGNGSSALSWVQANLPDTAAVVFCCPVDDNGLAAVRPQVLALLEAGGTARFIVSSTPATLELMEVEHSGVSVVRDPVGLFSAVALRLRDGTARCLLGRFDLTTQGLASGFTMVLDGVRDVPAAHGLLHELELLTPKPVQGAARALTDLMQPAMDALEALTGREGSTGPHKTGFAELDHLTGTDHGGQLWLITGSVGIGKTTLALGLARG